MVPAGRCSTFGDGRVFLPEVDIVVDSLDSDRQIRKPEIYLVEYRPRAAGSQRYQESHVPPRATNPLDNWRIGRGVRASFKACTSQLNQREKEAKQNAVCEAAQRVIRARESKQSRKAPQGGTVLQSGRSESTVRIVRCGAGSPRPKPWRLRLSLTIAREQHNRATIAVSHARRVLDHRSVQTQPDCIPSGPGAAGMLVQPTQSSRSRLCMSRATVSKLPPTPILSTNPQLSRK